MSCQGTGYTILPGNHCTEKMSTAKNILKLNKGTHFAWGKQSNLVVIHTPINRNPATRSAIEQPLKFNSDFITVCYPNLLDFPCRLTTV
jgi:hypothetical protein